MADKAPITDSPTDPSTRCSEPGCESRRRGRGLCAIHYQRVLRRGALAGHKRTKRGVYYREAFIRENVNYADDACLMWPFGKAKERASTIKINGVNHKAYHWMCIFVHGPAPTPGHEAAHSCGNGHIGCVSPRHIRWATRKENIADMRQHGTSLHGETAPWSRLTAEQARAAFLDERPAQAVAVELGVERKSISDIRTRKNWKAATAGLVAPTRARGRAVAA